MSEAFGPIGINDRIFAMIIKNNKPFIMNSLGQIAHIPNNEKYVNLIRKIFHSDVNRYKKPNHLTCRNEEIPEVIETYDN